MIKKHRDEQGVPPENTAIYWMANDIMWADGEGMAQIMYLLGVKPVWQSNGRVSGLKSFLLISLAVNGSMLPYASLVLSVIISALA